MKALSSSLKGKWEDRLESLVVKDELRCTSKRLLIDRLKQAGLDTQQEAESLAAIEAGLKVLNASRIALARASDQALEPLRLSNSDPNSSPPHAADSFAAPRKSRLRRLWDRLRSHPLPWAHAQETSSTRH
ncbi:hypothetical protein [Eleftheria terrae]|uniref:hypothetical protein n=1 Tax=Eleftheria terrae TaxID=1597781 RepID=UPI00263A53D3|nr:hypothetical protein [Eleftheria terrae]WKB55954.1 hypothetical protein N7L95_28180 [Eleftheria terrae]